jgi:hypothetical protein
MITAFTSQGKSGKTTLASILLALLKQGGSLAGLPLAPGKAVVVTEESRLTWDERRRRLGIDDACVHFLCRPFHGARPTAEQWRAFVANLGKLHRQDGFDLLMIDPLASFLPGGAENYAPAMLDFLLPLQVLAESGPAIWLLHHPGKARRADGHAGRGTSALGGFVDISIEMSCVKRLRSPDRRRRLRAYSRKDETPRHLLIELNAEGTDYTVPTPESRLNTVERWAEVEAILASAFAKMTHSEIVELWPEDRDPPDRATLYRWLRAATQEGRICCAGSGEKGDPFRYWLPDRAPILRPDAGASKEEMQAWNERYVTEVWAHLERYQAAHGIRPAGGGAP